MSPQQQPEGGGNKFSLADFKAFVNLMTWICHIASVTVDVFLHLGPGERYIGLPGLLAVPVVLLYGAITAPFGGAALLTFVPIYILMCIIWKQWAVYRRKRLKRLVHSRWCGKPWLSYLFPRLSELNLRRLESILVFLAGLTTLPVDHPVGIFLMFISIAQAMSLSMEQMIILNRELDDADNMIEQQQRAMRSREMMGR